MAPTLTDPFARQIDYIRLSVTDRCDLRCYYCMPEGHTDFEAPEDWLSFDEIERVIAAFGRLGVQRVRVTGGEPLVRKNLSELTTRLARLPGITDLSLSSNAVQLERHAQALFDSGVRRLNISLDTLKPERFKAITQGKLDKVIHGLMAAKAAGFAPIKINMVVMRGVNDDELVEMLEFCRQHGFTLRFIETMPMGDTGRNASAQYLPMDEVITTLKQHYSLIPGVMPGGGPARYMQLAGEAMKIGFITPMSQHFCETCNRVRLSVDGTLYMCLGQDHRFALRPLLRAGISDTELEQAIIQAIALKPERHEFSEKPEQVVRFMSMTGG
ncbi:MAG: GTP 3',8-cyclase MoaA [Thiohalomonadaceae bacterium]